MRTLEGVGKSPIDLPYALRDRNSMRNQKSSNCLCVSMFSVPSIYTKATDLKLYTVNSQQWSLRLYVSHIRRCQVLWMGIHTELVSRHCPIHSEVGSIEGLTGRTYPCRDRRRVGSVQRRSSRCGCLLGKLNIEPGSQDGQDRAH